MLSPEMNNHPKIGGISYGLDSFILRPGNPNFAPSEVDTSVQLSPHIKLSDPIMTAAMDTISEKEMIIAQAENGCIGTLHGNLTLEEQVDQITSVKREGGSNVIFDPYVAYPDMSLSAARAKMQSEDVSCLPVVKGQDSKLLVGILTEKDFRFKELESTNVEQAMTPMERVEAAPEGTTIEQAREFFASSHHHDWLPLVNNLNELVGLITAKDVENTNQGARDKLGRLLVAAAIRLNQDPLEQARELKRAEADIIVVDAKYAYSKFVGGVISAVREEVDGSDILVAGGNITCSDGGRFVVDSGAHMPKVGVGPGGSCITRDVTGSGRGQFTAVLEVADEFKNDDEKIHVIADGGVRNGGHIAKLIGAGASLAMIGSYFRGTDEVPQPEGFKRERNGEVEFLFRGMGQKDAILRGRKTGQRGYIEGQDEDDIVEEGGYTWVPSQGPVKRKNKQLHGQLVSGMHLSGNRTIEEHQKNAVFEYIDAGMRDETSPYAVS